MPDIAGPFGTASWGQSGWYRDAYARSVTGVYGAPVSSVSNGDLGLTLNGLSWSVGLGRAHVRGAGYERTGTPSTGSVTANSTGNPRIDRLVLRRDLTAGTVTVVRIQGTAAATPTAPTLSAVEDGAWDLALFRFTVPPSSGTTLTSVTDERYWLSPQGSAAPLPRIRVYRTVADPYSNTAFGAIPFDTLEPTYTYNPGGDFFVPKLDVSERRILLPKDGHYGIHGASGFNTSQSPTGNQVRLTRMPNPGNQALTEAQALTTLGNVTVSGAVDWTGFLPAGTHIGLGILVGTNGGNNLVENTNGYRTELMITRLSD